MPRKYFLLSLFFGPFLLSVLSVLLISFYPNLASKSIKISSRIDIVQHRIDDFQKYKMSSDDFDFLQRFPKTLQSGNELFAAYLNVMRKIIYFTLIISFIQAVGIIVIYRREKREG